MKLQNYSVMPLIPEKIGEICDDIERQVKERICSVPLFMMTLVPVGTPPRKEAEYLCESFDLFRDRLAERGIAAGILVQASLGHDGRHLPEPSPFTKLVRLSDGVSPEICCPADPAFRAHFRAVFRTLASHRPSVIMLDDDFRLMARPGRGCACERHLAEFNRRAGTALTREQLWEHISEKGANDPLTKIYIQTQIDSLIDCVREMRAGVDEIDPKIPGAYCTCGNSCEGAAEIASILAGEGNPSVVRLNNANYTSPGARFLSRPFLRAAYQREALGGRADVLLAETDTCPQLRYSTSASMLHAHFSGSILEGARGAKQWITDLENADIRDGEAYRRILAKYAGFYEALADLEKDVTPVGCRIPLSSEPSYYYSKDLLYQPSNGAFFKHAFAQNVLERLGLPLYFSSKAGGVAFLLTLLDGVHHRAKMLAKHAHLVLAGVLELRHRIVATLDDVLHRIGKLRDGFYEQLVEQQHYDNHYNEGQDEFSKRTYEILMLHYLYRLGVEFGVHHAVHFIFVLNRLYRDDIFAVFRE